MISSLLAVVFRPTSSPKLGGSRQPATPTEGKKASWPKLLWMNGDWWTRWRKVKASGFGTRPGQLYGKGSAPYRGTGLKTKGDGGAGSEKGTLGKLNFVSKYSTPCRLTRVGSAMRGRCSASWTCLNEESCAEGAISRLVSSELSVSAGVFSVLISAIEDRRFEIIIRTNFTLVAFKGRP